MKWTLENRMQLIKETVERHKLNKERLEKKLALQLSQDETEECREIEMYLQGREVG